MVFCRRDTSRLELCRPALIAKFISNLIIFQTRRIASLRFSFIDNVFEYLFFEFKMFTDFKHGIYILTYKKPYPFCVSLCILIATLLFIISEAVYFDTKHSIVQLLALLLQICNQLVELQLIPMSFYLNPLSMTSFYLEIDCGNYI